MNAKEPRIYLRVFILKLKNNLQNIFTLQVKSEHIKNSRYSRQYRTFGYLFVRIFLILLAFGLIPSFDETGTLIKNLYPSIGSCFVWLAVPLCTVIAWIFHTKECIGHIGKYLFEGSASDVPISTISRDIQMIFVKY